MADAPLVLDVEALNRRTADLFADLDASPDVRAQLRSDPVGLFAARLGGPELPSPGDVSRGNRLLFALLANAEFRSWATERQRSLDEGLARARATEGMAGVERFLREEASREDLYRETIDAMRRYLDPDLLSEVLDEPVRAALTGAARLPPPPKPVNVNLMWTVTAVAIALFLVITAFDMTPVAPDPEQALTRVDLDRISRVLTTELRADE